MKNKFTLGAIAGISSLALAVPILAQMSSAQSAPRLPATHTLPVVQQTSSVQADATDTPDVPGAVDQQEGKDGKDTDNIQSEDKTGTDTEKPNGAEAKDTDNVQQEGNHVDAGDLPGSL
jgi:hypothetical protein